MKTIEEMLYVEFRPDPHLIADCCQESDGRHALDINEVIARFRIEKHDRVPFECPNCRTKYELLKEHVDKAQTRKMPYAASKNQS